MIIPFDIKYRDKIESGEYKVVLRRANELVDIRYWDRKDETTHKTIVGVIRYGSVEEICAWKQDGTRCDAYLNNPQYDLMIMTNDEELSEFEKLFDKLATQYIQEKDKASENIKKFTNQFMNLVMERMSGFNPDEDFNKGIIIGEKQAISKIMGEIPRCCVAEKEISGEEHYIVINRNNKASIAKHINVGDKYISLKDIVNFYTK